MTSTKTRQKRNTLRNTASYYKVKLKQDQRKLWTPEEVRALENYMDEPTATVWGACKRFDRSVYSIKNKMTRMGLKLRVRPEMTVAEIASELGVSVDRTLRAIRDGYLPATKRREGVATAEHYRLNYDDVVKCMPLLKAPSKTWRRKGEEPVRSFMGTNSQRALEMMRGSGEFCCLELKSDYHYGWELGLIRGDSPHDEYDFISGFYDKPDECIREAWLWWKFGVSKTQKPTQRDEKSPSSAHGTSKTSKRFAS